MKNRRSESQTQSEPFIFLNFCKKFLSFGSCFVLMYIKIKNIKIKKTSQKIYFVLIKLFLLETTCQTGESKWLKIDKKTIHRFYLVVAIALNDSLFSIFHHLFHVSLANNCWLKAVRTVLNRTKAVKYSFELSLSQDQSS